MRAWVERNARWLVFRGIAAIAFGIVAIAWPGITFVALLALFGAFAFIEGGLTLLSGLHLLVERQTNWIGMVLAGLAGIAIGAVTFLWPGITALSLVYVIAFWAILIGVFEIDGAFELRGKLPNGWMLGLSGILSIAFGILIAAYPRSGVLAIIWIIGIYAIASGLMRLYMAYHFYKFRHDVRDAQAQSPAWHSLTPHVGRQSCMAAPSSMPATLEPEIPEGRDDVTSVSGMALISVAVIEQ